MTRCWFPVSPRLLGRPRADLASASSPPRHNSRRAREAARIWRASQQRRTRRRPGARFSTRSPRSARRARRFRPVWLALGRDAHLVKGPSAGEGVSGSGARETLTRGGGDPLVATPDIPVRPFFMGAELRKAGRHTSTTISSWALANHERGSRLGGVAEAQTSPRSAIAVDEIRVSLPRWLTSRRAARMHICRLLPRDARTLADPTAPRERSPTPRRASPSLEPESPARVLPRAFRA